MRSSTSPLAENLIHILALGGQHDDRHVGVVADGTAHALARNAGKHQVQDHQIEMMLGELLERLLTVADGGDPVILALEISRNRVADGFFVFDQKDTTRLVVAHDLTSISSTACRMRAAAHAHCRTSRALCTG